MLLGAFHKLRHMNLMIFFIPPHPCHISETPLPSVTSHIFSILHLEIIKLKQQKCDVTKFRIPPMSLNVTLRRPPPPLLTCDVIYGCPLIALYISTP